VVEHDEVAVLEVEAVQLVACALGVHDIFVDDEGSAFGVGCDALADLAAYWLLVEWSRATSESCSYRMGPALLLADTSHQQCV
jgi:hypothetical protein